MHEKDYICNKYLLNKILKKTTPNYWITVAHKKKYIFEDIIIFYLTKISYNSGVCAVKLY